MSSKNVLKQWLLGAPSNLPRILLLDGGVSTWLESQGATFAHRALWSSSLLLTEPARIKQGHKDWMEDGGVNLISTVTYQCHYEPTLWPPGGVIRDEADMDDLWRKAVQLAKEAVHECTSSATATNNNYRGVVASSGCFGAALANGAEYTGDYGDQTTVADLQRFHARKMRTMASMDAVDAIAIETIPSLAECRALRDLFTTLSTDDTTPNTITGDKACWISLSCRNGHELNDGTKVAEALQVLDEIPIDAVQAFGFNCCHADHLPSLLHILVQHYQQQTTPNRGRRRAIVLYPNSGETWNAAQQDWEKGTECDNMANHLMKCIQQIEQAFAGTQDEEDCRIIVGGCCRTTPAVLASLRKQVEEHLGEKK
mmetsp:Transcript_15661/g.29614  ORF Transcript_15661/g.29614 Transcript_15661/m.29614 type:complete len:370 (-) Transcript_15661:324-1433(-)